MWIAIGIILVWLLILTLNKASDSETTELRNRLFGLAEQLGVDAKTIERPLRHDDSALGQIKRRLYYLENQERGQQLAMELTLYSGQQYDYCGDGLIHNGYQALNFEMAKQEINRLLADKHRMGDCAPRKSRK